MTRSQNPWLRLDKRPEEERVQWLIVLKDYPTVRRGTSTCFPLTSIFLLPFCVSGSWPRHSQIHRSGARTQAFITRSTPVNFPPVEVLQGGRESTWETASLILPKISTKLCIYLWSRFSQTRRTPLRGWLLVLQ